MEIVIALAVAAAVVGLVAYLRSRRGPSRRGPGAGGRPGADKH